MGWNKNPLGIVLDQTMNADFPALKSNGFSFVVIEAGLGFDVGNQSAVNPALGDQLSKARDAGLPAIVQWTPFPAFDDYTFTQVGPAQVACAQKALASKVYYGFVVSMERYWTGLDQELGHALRQATPDAINQVASDFAHSFKKLLDPLSHPVLIRTNDGFVQTYSPALGMGWTDQFGFYLADWRYRTRANDGQWSQYVPYKAARTLISSMDQLRAEMPPDNSKNPLVPGNTPQLKFWEYSGNRYVFPWIKAWNNGEVRSKVVLFNGTEDALKAYLSYTVTNPVPTPIPTPSNPPTTGTPGGGPVGPVDVQPILDALSKIAADVAAIKEDVHQIASK